MKRVSLPVVPSSSVDDDDDASARSMELVKSSLRSDGRRERIVTADVRGRFTRARTVVRWALMAFAIALPLIRIEGRPALFLDVPARRFFLFGASLNAQDAWLLFFGLTALGFGLLVLTTMLGRAWCGWACPQTVLLEGLFRPVERLFEGPRNQKLRRDAGPWTLERTARAIAKHVAFVLMAALSAHVIVAYFASLPSLGAMILEGPLAHPEAFLWCTVMGAVIYLDMAWFREQLCLVVCPYGRLQSVLTDDDSLHVGYDARRGEPRGHRKKGQSAPLGDCVDCNRCVVVCPTGIDIRNGLQVDCIGCTACIDACDDVMDKLERPRGLIRYDSSSGLATGARRWMRPRVWLYLGLAAIGAGALTLALSSREPLEATLVRAPGTLFVRDADAIRNTFVLHLVNKRDASGEVDVEVIERPTGAEVVLASPRVTMAALESRRVMVVVRVPGDVPPGATLALSVRGLGMDPPIELRAPIVGPRRLAP